jgi:hypothetical protein
MEWGKPVPLIFGLVVGFTGDGLHAPELQQVPQDFDRHEEEPEMTRKHKGTKRSLN